MRHYPNNSNKHPNYKYSPRNRPGHPQQEHTRFALYCYYIRFNRTPPGFEKLIEDHVTYKLIKIKLKQALYKDDLTRPILEKNIKDLKEKGLGYLAIIKNTIPIIEEKVLKDITK